MQPASAPQVKLMEDESSIRGSPGFSVQPRGLAARRDRAMVDYGWRGIPAMTVVDAKGEVVVQPGHAIGNLEQLKGLLK